MATRIISNGSRYPGDPPTSLDDLEHVLKTYALEDWSATSKVGPNRVRIWGNFKRLSHVFCIEFDDPKLINKFRRLIYKNKRATTLA